MLDIEKDRLAEGHINQFKRLSDRVKKYLLISSLPFSIGKNYVDVRRMWPTGCNLCRKSFGSKSVVEKIAVPVGNTKPTFMIVGANPGYGNGPTKEIGPTLVTGASSQILRKALAKIGIVHECWFTNVVKCATLNNERICDNDVRTCRMYIDCELWTLKPKYVVTLGIAASNALGRTSIKVTHPAFYVRNGKSYVQYAEHIYEKLKR